MLFESRNKLIDFPYPWIKSVGALMIPSAKGGERITQHPLSNIGAVWKPFQIQVFVFAI